MQLTFHAEYALRVLLYLGSRPGETVATKEISSAFGVSKNHLVRVIQTLGDAGYLGAVPGRGGGVSLAMEPSRIRLGDVVRKAEPNFRIAECFDAERNTCVLAPVCSLKPVLKKALNSFLATLDEYTLADLLAGGNRLKLSRVLTTIATNSRVM
ncbi:MAG: Rrf2 family transcriptional regulator [Acidobacteriota bacterium]